MRPRGMQGMIIKMSNPDILSKTGRELLPDETVEYFKEIRSINYFNVLNKTLSEYTFAEWYVCLDEKVLLEQCLSRRGEEGWGIVRDGHADEKKPYCSEDSLLRKGLLISSA